MIYFYIFIILYLEKKYTRSVPSREGPFFFFSSAFYTVRKEKHQTRSNLRGLNFCGLSFVNFKCCFNTSTHQFLYGCFRLSWVTWTKTSRFGSKCENRPERARTGATTGGSVILGRMWIRREFVDLEESVVSVPALMDALWNLIYASYVELILAQKHRIQ